MKTLSNACLIQIQFDYGLISTRHERGGVFCNHLARKTLAGYFFFWKHTWGTRVPTWIDYPLMPGKPVLGTESSVVVVTTLFRSTGYRVRQRVDNTITWRIWSTRDQQQACESTAGYYICALGILHKGSGTYHNSR